MQILIGIEVGELLGEVSVGCGLGEFAACVAFGGP